MQVCRTISQLQRALAALPRPLGFVPTMGYLHEGHLSLVRQARAENASVAVSIFVNPTQFGPQEDLARYPRDLARDRKLLAEAAVDLLFAPEAEEMYPPGFATWVEVKGLSEHLEGAFRPGHFRGVATVVTKLLNLFRPERAYFGEKDAQQLAIVRRLAADLNLGCTIVGLPTVREADGLALSSRNVYLSPEERQRAPLLYRSLKAGYDLWRQGERRTARIIDEVRRTLQAESKAFRVDYIALVDEETFQEMEFVERPARLLIAARLGRTRLIDNLPLK
ncbi:MAG: pantoate--beta-alanine ligase [Bacillota bacterium]|nr:pantoate--beta-alanine ligase [Bacillota bacterium]